MRLLAEALGAQLHLLDRFLAGDIGGAQRLGAAGDGGHDLQQQGGLADAGIAADQDGGAAHQPAAGDAVELGIAGRTPHRLWRLAVERDELDGLALTAGEALGHLLAPGLFHDAVPGIAGLALAHPAGEAGAATLTDIAGRRFRHRRFSAAYSGLTGILIGPPALPCTNCSTWALPE